MVLFLQRLLKDSDQQQNKLGHLNALVKQMESLCDAVPQMEKFADLSHRSFDLRARTSDKVNDLEEIAEQIEDYEIELTELKHWMDKTRAHLTMRDDTLTLKDQLKMQEVIKFSEIFTRTRLCSFDPLKPHFYTVKLGFAWIYINILISAQKHRLWLLVRTTSLMYPPSTNNLCFEQKYENYQNFLSESFH